MNLFVYGTLMVPAIMRAVCGYDRPGRRALLPGYARRRVVGEVYPGVRVQPGEDVDGILYPAVSDAQIGLLDLFEGELYRRQDVVVQVDRRPVAAFCYVLEPNAHDALSGEPWTLEAFLRDGHAAFVGEYRGFAAVARRGRTHDDER
jgi:gamma-glutamylcyclotransferase (GGCT)/AIG2-like uncharacterized protein YtfP